MLGFLKFGFSPQEGGPRGRGRFARQADHAQSVRPVGGHFHVIDDVVEAQGLGQRRSGFGASLPRAGTRGKVHDLLFAVRIALGQIQFIGPADHARRPDAADLGRRQDHGLALPVPAHAGADLGKSDELAFAQITAAANHLQLFRTDVHGREAQFVGVGVLGQSNDPADHHHIQILALPMQTVDRWPDLGDRQSEIFRLLLQAHVLPEPLVRYFDIHVIRYA